MVDQLKNIYNVNNIINLDFKHLFNNAILADLHCTIYALFMNYYSSLNLSDIIDIDYFKTSILLYHNFFPK